MRAEVATLQTAPRAAAVAARPRRLGAALRILRPGNGAITALGVATGAVVAGGFPALASPWPWLAALAGFFATGFGNALNDVHDAQLDRLAHPTRPLPRGDLSRAQGLAVALGAGALGLALGAVVSLHAAAFVGATLVLMALYEGVLKARGLSGNVVVALLTGAPFLFGALAVAGIAGLLGAAAVAAALAALANLGREILKDVEDMQADVDRATLPRTHGRSVARQVAAVSLLAAVLASPLPWLRGDVGWLYLPIVALADALFVAAAFHARPHRAQAIAKGGMLVALVAFLAGGLA